ncbi:MAG: bifunctional diguanylate cyclase/phosphodiesterase, partial [Candidatus Nanopelagicales bacterium]|nr:bifunctional diguanylate cyclase/phosphodiesterase [Candidatus Nanopelagicales bacterium]
PYAPIADDISRGTNQLYLVLAGGLLLLYIALFLVSLSVTRRLLRQVTENQYLAEHDVLTGLPNRMVFQRSLDEHLRRHAESGDGAIVAIVDLDRFKVINDTLGHSIGDALLLQMGERLRSSLPTGSTVARLGGDEFGILLTGATDVQGALWRIKEVLEQEVEIEGLPKVAVDCSIGYALQGIDGDTTELLLQRAEIAMYFAKQHHVGIFHYDEQHDRHDPAQLALVGEMRRAIDHDELVVHYQPKVQMGDGQVRAVEALVRWQHPRLGLIQPDDFIALVEETELVHDLTHWVLARALGDLAALGAVAHDLTVAVNVSARNLSRPGFPRRIADAIAASGLAPERLSIEITETALLTSPERALAILEEIASQGVQISIDDFGVGQTSLSYVASMPIAEVKIDRSFVTDMTTDPVHGVIVGSIIDLAHGLRMRVVAEGVESEATAVTLASMGCDLAQGSLYSQPLAYDTLRFWLTQRQSGSQG